MPSRRSPVPGEVTVRRGAVLAVLCVSLFLIAVDATVLFTAVPALAARLRPGPVELLWIADVYSLTAAPLLLTFGALGDRLGHRRVLLTGYAVFGVASALVAFAPGVPFLIAARAVLGAGGAMIMPSTLSVLRQLYPEPAERAKAIGVWTATASSGAVLGPLFGGLLVQNLWWGAAFLINVPIMLVTFPLSRRLLPGPGARGRGPWDAGGTMLAVAGVLALALGIKQAGHSGVFSPAALIATPVGAVLLAAFVFRQLRHRAPLLNVRLFGRPEFSGAVLSVLGVLISLTGLELLFAQYFQLVLGDSPFTAGLRMLPLGLATIAGGLLAGVPPLNRVATPLLTGGGLVFTAVALVPLLWLGVADSPSLITAGFLGLGLGSSAALTAASVTLMNVTRAEQAGSVAAVEETAYELGSGLGIVIIGTVVATAYQHRFPALPGVPAELTELARRSLPDALRAAAAESSRALAPAARATFVDSLRTALLVAMGVLTATALATVRRPFPRKPPQGEPE